MGRNYAHVVDVPFWDYMIRILQAILALALVILTVYALVFDNYRSVRLSVFTVSILEWHCETGTNFLLLVPLGCGYSGLLSYCRPCAAIHL